MGMIEISAKLFMEQSRFHNFNNCHLLTIGKQGITFSIEELNSWATEFNFRLEKSCFKNALTENRPLTDVEFFMSLGFKSVDSMDCSEYEGASLICNLNDDIPTTLYNKFDVVFDGGSTEHMFNVPKAFENYNKMLKVGGLIIHSLPSTGYLDHGFYMFSPTLLYDYYSQNHWNITTNYMCQLPYDNMNSWTIYEYEEPGPFLEHIEFKGRWGIFFVAQKQIESTFNCNISQNYFKKLWKNKPANSMTDESNVGIIKKLFRMLPPNLRIKIRRLIFGKPVVPFKKKEIR